MEVGRILKAGEVPLRDITRQILDEYDVRVQTIDYAGEERRVVYPALFGFAPICRVYAGAIGVLQYKSIPMLEAALMVALKILGTRYFRLEGTDAFRLKLTKVVVALSEHDIQIADNPWFLEEKEKFLRDEEAYIAGIKNEIFSFREYMEWFSEGFDWGNEDLILFQECASDILDSGSESPSDLTKEQFQDIFNLYIQKGGDPRMALVISGYMHTQLNVPEEVVSAVLEFGEEKMRQKIVMTTKN
jgi:hypothetical protein